MAKHALSSLTALGHRTPVVIEIGPYRIVERFDVALASLAARQGREKDVIKAAKAAKIPLPEAAEAMQAAVFSAFWLSPGQWMIEAPFETHEDIVSILKPRFGEAASITEQTDAWVRFDLSSNLLVLLLERLCNVDFAKVPVSYATRTVIEHLGCYLIKRGADSITLYGPRSSAASLLHAIETAARSLV